MCWSVHVFVSGGGGGGGGAFYHMLVAGVKSVEAWKLMQIFAPICVSVKINWKLIRWSAAAWKLIQIFTPICVSVKINWKLIRWTVEAWKLIQIFSRSAWMKNNSLNRGGVKIDSDFSPNLRECEN